MKTDVHFSPAQSCWFPCSGRFGGQQIVFSMYTGLVLIILGTQFTAHLRMLSDVSAAAYDDKSAYAQCIFAYTPGK